MQAQKRSFIQKGYSRLFITGNFCIFLEWRNVNWFTRDLTQNISQSVYIPPFQKIQKKSFKPSHLQVKTILNFEYPILILHNQSHANAQSKIYNFLFAICLRIFLFYFYFSQVNCKLPRVKNQTKANTNAQQKMKLDPNILIRHNFMSEVSTFKKRRKT